MTSDEYRRSESLFDPTNTKAPKSLTRGQADRLFAIAIDALFDTTQSDAEANAKVDDYNGFIYFNTADPIPFHLEYREDCRKAGFLPAKAPRKT